LKTTGHFTAPAMTQIINLLMTQGGELNCMEGLETKASSLTFISRLLMLLHAEMQEKTGERELLHPRVPLIHPT
jgi:hypothetical protein